MWAELFFLTTIAAAGFDVVIVLALKDNLVVEVLSNYPAAVKVT